MAISTVIWKRIARCHRTSGAADSSLYPNLTGYCLQPAQSSKHFFLMDFAPVWTRPPHLISSPLSVANVNYYRTTYIFLPQNVMYKSAPQLRAGGHVAFSTGAAATAAGLDFMPRNLVLPGSMSPSEKACSEFGS